jgi:Pentapeptide repeats (9 copies)
MTNLSLDKRLLEHFGAESEKSRVRLMADWATSWVLDHQAWLRTEGRYGSRLDFTQPPINGRAHRKLFERVILDGIDFSQAVIVKTSFAWSNLRLTCFAGATLQEIRFEDCDLEGADFSGARFENVSFHHCLDLAKACFDGVSYTGPRQDGERKGDKDEPSKPLGESPTPHPVLKVT